MKKITKEESIELMKEKFPRFIPYWEKDIENFGLDQGFTTQLMPFEDYTIDVIKSHDATEIKRIFDFVEFLLCDEPISLIFLKS